MHRPLRPVMLWTAAFAVILGLVAVTEIARTFLTLSRLDVIYNQFYVVKDAAFVTSFANAEKWLLAARLNALTTPNSFQTTAQALANLTATVAKATEDLTLVLDPGYAFFTNDASTAYLKAMQTADNCPLIAEPRVACNDAASAALFRDGLFFYQSFGVTVTEMLAADLDAPAGRPPGFASLSAISQRLFLGLQSHVFP